MTSSINRRSLVKGATIAAPVAAAAAWSTPALANSTSVDPYKGSSTTPEGNQVTGGMFVSVRGENIGTNTDPIYIDMLSGGSGNGVIDRNWDDAQNKITGAPAVRNTNGYVTPYGTLGGMSTTPGQVPSFQTYGGTGMWFSSPVAPTGSKTGNYFSDYSGIKGGSTTLKAGAAFTLTVRVEYTSAASQTRFRPYMGREGVDPYWTAGQTLTIDKKASTQGSRISISAARVKMVWGQWTETQENGKYVSYGTINMTTLDDAVAPTASNGAPQFQQLTLVPPLKISGAYQVPGNPGDVQAVSVTLAPAGNIQFVSSANGQAITQLPQLGSVEAHLTGPGMNI